MKSTSRQVSEYIKKCAEKGIVSLDEIHDSLRSDISQVEDQLQEVEPLRLKCRNLQKMSDHISSMLQTDKITTEFDDDSDELKAIRAKVINIIDKQGPLSNREIIMKAGYNKDMYIIRSIKFLSRCGVLAKGDDKRIIKGPKWDER